MGKSMGQQVFKILIFFIFCYSQIVSAVIILVATDDPTQEKAKAVQSTLLKTPPFSMLKDFKVHLKYISKDQVVCKRPFTDPPAGEEKQTAKSAVQEVRKEPESCRKMKADAMQAADSTAAKIAQEQIADSSRLMNCDFTSALSSISGETNADFTVFVKDSEEWAGAGGGSVVTMTKIMPPLTAVHEFLHTLGFADEYEYPSACEADTYCPYLIAGYFSAHNVAVFKDSPPYSSDIDARVKHANQIPWYEKIEEDTSIITGDQLGTPKAKDKIGLHQLSVCDLATDKVKSWKPGATITVMDDLEYGGVPSMFWEGIANKLGTELVSQESSPPNKRVKSKAKVKTTF